MRSTQSARASADIRCTWPATPLPDKWRMVGTSEAVMSDGLNKVMLIGNLGQDPELRFTQGGQAVLNLRIATNESYLNRDGERQERTEWHSVIIWGKRGEGLNKVLSKGKQIFVEGRLQTRQWEDKAGAKRYTTEVVATDVVLLGGGSGRGAGAGTGAGSAGRAYEDQQGGPPDRGGSERPPDIQGGDDDIPF
jgi:single-strand DNA-binding protein